MNPYNAYARAHELVDEDDKGRVLVKVFQVLPDKIESVKAAIAEKNYEKKYQELTRIVMVLDVLNQSLDMSYGEIPNNLSLLYDYLTRKLREVHATLDITTLDECKEIIVKIGDGFAQAYQASRNPVRRVPTGAASSIQSQV